MDLAQLLQLYWGSWEKDSKLIIVDFYGKELYNDVCDINRRGFIMDKIFNDEMSNYIWSCEIDGFGFENKTMIVQLKKDKRLHAYLYEYMIDYVEKLIKKEFGNAFRRTINFYYKNGGDWVVEFMADTEDYRTVFYVVQGYENKIFETDTYGDSGDSATAFLSYVKDLVKSF